MKDLILNWFLLAITPPAYPGMPTPPVELDVDRHTLRQTSMTVNTRVEAVSWWTPIQCRPGARVERFQAPNAVSFKCIDSQSGRFSGEGRSIEYGQRKIYIRKYLVPVSEEESVRDGLFYRQGLGYPEEASLYRLGKPMLEQRWVGGHLREVRVEDDHGLVQAWAYFESPPYERPSSYFYNHSDGRILDIQWDAHGRIKLLRQRQKGIGVFGRWIVYNNNHSIALFARCARRKSASEGEGTWASSYDIVWEMPKVFKVPGGYEWVSLADAEAARSRPCTIDGEEIPAILPSEIPKPQSYPRQPIDYQLSRVLHVDLPKVHGRKPDRAHVLLYDLLKDAGPWRTAAIDASGHVNLTTVTTSHGQPWEVANRAFAELWASERRSDFALTQANQIELARRIVQSITPKDQAAVKTRYGLP